MNNTLLYTLKISIGTVFLSLFLSSTGFALVSNEYTFTLQPLAQAEKSDTIQQSLDDTEKSPSPSQGASPVTPNTPPSSTGADSYDYPDEYSESLDDDLENDAELDDDEDEENDGTDDTLSINDDLPEDDYQQDILDENYYDQNRDAKVKRDRLVQGNDQKLPEYVLTMYDVEEPDEDIQKGDRQAPNLLAQEKKRPDKQEKNCPDDKQEEKVN